MEMEEPKEPKEYTQEEKDALRKNKATLIISTCSFCPYYEMDENKTRYICRHRGKFLWWDCSEEEEICAIPDWCLLIKKG